MFARDAKAIREWIESAPTPEERGARFHRVTTFVLLTIRQPFERTPADMAAVDRLGDSARSILFGSKRLGFRYSRRYSASLYRQALEAAQDGDDLTLLLLLCRVPGLGCAKAGFLAQLAFGRIGCLDSHNLLRFKLDAKAFRIGGVSRKTAIERTRLYISTCKRLGGAASLWDSWCEYVANDANGRGRRTVKRGLYQGFVFGFDGIARTGADAVSFLHVEAIIGSLTPTMEVAA